MRSVRTLAATLATLGGYPDTFIAMIHKRGFRPILPAASALPLTDHWFPDTLLGTRSLGYDNGVFQIGLLIHRAVPSWPSQNANQP